MKHFLSTLLVASTAILFAGEPFLLNTPGSEFPKSAKVTGKKMQANMEGQSNIVIKMNISQLVLKTLAFQAEYGFHKNLSVALGYHLFLARPLPGFFGGEDPTGEGLRNTRLGGWSITPEFRFYPGPKVEHQAPHGFYLAPYFRYAKYTFTSSYHEVYSGNNKEYGYDMTLTYGGYTAGLMIGAQWLLGKHFSLDWWIIGAGFGKAKMEMNAVGSGFILNSAEREELKRELEEEFEDVGTVFKSKPTVETTQNSAKVTIPGLPMASYRGFGICLGYAF